MRPRYLPDCCCDCREEPPDPPEYEPEPDEDAEPDEPGDGQPDPRYSRAEFERVRRAMR